MKVNEKFLAALSGAGLLLALSACGSDSKPSVSANASSSGGTSTPTTVRLGYFGNVTHAPAIVAVESAVGDESESAGDGV